MGAAHKTSFTLLGDNWAEIVLNEHAMLLEVGSSGEVIRVNELLEKHTGIAFREWKNTASWQKWIQGFEHGRNVDLLNRVQFGHTWKGLVRVTDAGGQVFLTNATVVPCLDVNENLNRVTILMNPTDVTYIAGTSDKTEESEKSIAISFSKQPNTQKTYRISKIASLGNEPVLVEWQNQPQEIRKNIQAGEDQFFTFILNGAPSIPIRFRINPLALQSLLPALMRTSVAATRYGIIHLTIEPVKLPEVGTVLRFRLEDTGERIGSGADRVVQRINENKSLSAEMDACRELFDICEADLFYRSDESGNIFEFLAEIDVLEPARKDSQGVKIFDSWPELRFYREMSADTFKVKAFEELSFSDLLSDRIPSTPDEAAFWIHAQRPTIFYLGNETVANDLKVFEKELRSAPLSDWQNRFLSYRETLLNWIHNFKHLNEETST